MQHHYNNNNYKYYRGSNMTEEYCFNALSPFAVGQYNYWKKKTRITEKGRE